MNLKFIVLILVKFSRCSLKLLFQKGTVNSGKCHNETAPMFCGLVRTFGTDPYEASAPNATTPETEYKVHFEPRKVPLPKRYQIQSPFGTDAFLRFSTGPGNIAKACALFNSPIRKINFQEDENDKSDDDYYDLTAKEENSGSSAN